MTEIRLEGLHKAFGDAPALRGVDLTIPSGAFVSLLGPSGCGKTTLLRAIAGLEPPDQGTIRLDGEDIAPIAPEDRNLGFVFQTYALFPHMRVWDNVAFGLSVRGEDKAEQDARVEEMLGIVQLDGLADRFPAQLSGGQRQRVALARTLITRPRVLMLDEPLANLDTELRAEMRRFIRDMQRRFGLTTLLVTHDQGEALEMSDQVAVLLDGQVAQVDTPERLYTSPVSARVARFLGAENLFPARIEGDIARTPLGDLTVGPGHPQGPATVMLRGEAIRLHATPPSTPNLRAVVARRDYAGPIVRYALTVGQAHLLVTAPAQGLLDPGAETSLSIAPNEIWVLPPEGDPQEGSRP